MDNYLDQTPLRIIGIAGEHGAGKTTIAKEVQKSLLDGVIIPIARPVHEMLRWTGVPYKNIFGGSWDRNAPLEILGNISAREATRRFIRAGREIDENIWIQALCTRIASVTAKDIVIDDVETQYEVDKIVEAGGIVLELINRGDCNDHPDHLLNTTVIDNEGTVEEGVRNVLAQVSKVTR